MSQRQSLQSSLNEVQTKYDCPLLKYYDLNEEHVYTITRARKYQTKYGQSVLLHLAYDENGKETQISTFLPRRYVEHIDSDEKIKILNEGRPKMRFVKSGKSLLFDFTE